MDSIGNLPVDTLLSNALFALALPPVLMAVVKSSLDKNTKKLVAFLACLALTIVVGWHSDTLKFNLSDAKNTLAQLVLVVLVANGAYDKFWKPLIEKMSEQPLVMKFVRKTK